MSVAITVASLSLLFLGGPDAELSRDAHAPSPSTTTSRLPAEPPPTVVCVGDPAPDFAYQDYDGRWMRLHHLLDQGPILLLIGADPPRMAALERERNTLLSLGVIPVVVLDCKGKAAKALAAKTGARYTVLADARQVIAEQFNCVENGRTVPAWFVMDAHGKVCELARGALPAADYARLSARALALPWPGNVQPASRGPASPR